MDNMPINPKSSSKKTTWEKREEFEDGGYREIKVEEVSNGFIKCVTTYNDKGGYKTVKSIHEDNPMEEKSLVDKLEEFLKRG